MHQTIFYDNGFFFFFSFFLSFFFFIVNYATLLDTYRMQIVSLHYD